MLLQDTATKVRVGQELSEEFLSDIGCPQGDGLSPLLLTVYLEACLREVRSRLPERPCRGHGRAAETQYADGCNYFFLERQWLENALEIIKAVFSGFGLEVNTDKTEWVEFLHHDSDNRGNEEWRCTKQLGSLLGDAEDVSRRV